MLYKTINKILFLLSNINRILMSHMYKSSSQFEQKNTIILLKSVQTWVAYMHMLYSFIEVRM